MRFEHHHCSQRQIPVAVPELCRSATMAHYEYRMTNNMRTCFKLSCGLALLSAVGSATAQSTFSYFVSDAGGGNSLVTWDATGSIVTSSGVLWKSTTGSFGGLQVDAPGIYVDAYTGSLGPESIPALDGSYFHNTELNQDFPISLYVTHNATGSSDDYFALLSHAATTSAGQHIIYEAGTQSALIPVPFINFNLGSYQSVTGAGPSFDTAVTVNLTVVPEPSTMSLLALGGLLLFARLNQLLR